MASASSSWSRLQSVTKVHQSRPNLASQAEIKTIFLIIAGCVKGDSATLYCTETNCGKTMSKAKVLVYTFGMLAYVVTSPECGILHTPCKNEIDST